MSINCPEAKPPVDSQSNSCNHRYIQELVLHRAFWNRMEKNNNDVESEYKHWPLHKNIKTHNVKTNHLWKSVTYFRFLSTLCTQPQQVAVKDIKTFFFLPFAKAMAERGRIFT